MQYISLFIMILSFYLVFLVARSGAVASKKSDHSKKNFWDREAKANNVRRADISSLDYMQPDLTRLPLKQARELGCTDLTDRLEALAERRIINLSEYTNTDLKMMYGPANLDELSNYDSNYIELIRLLNSLGDAMLEKDCIDAAKSFYEYGISIGSDITNTFVQLGHIYMEQGDYNAFDYLLQHADKIKSLSGSIIITKLNNIKSEAK